MASPTNLEKLQDLLRQIFQFDSAELDFGIYKILNLKMDKFEGFLSKKLPKAVSYELRKGAIAEQSKTAKEMKEKEAEVRKALSENAIDFEGNLADSFKNTQVGKEYIELRERAAGARTQSALEAVIFNHLFMFFNRYYDKGDFITKRRYSKREKYAIPYNGEEVHLHWANNDQYYVKTGEHFNNYSFKSRGITVQFKIRNADVEQNNVKGDKRFFIPFVKEAEFNAKARVLFIPFEYRSLTDMEENAYGKKNHQDAIIAEAVESSAKQFKKESSILAALMGERRKTSNGETISYLEHHLKRYTNKNTSDYFINKNLKGFLERELDFYIKNEILIVDEIESGGESRAEGWFQLMRVIKSIGKTIITFLAQIEDFQKRLFEKKKFITETNYCVTVGNISKEFYDEIASNESQWIEWKEIFHINEEETDLFTPKTKEKRRVAFLKAHPTMVLDTKHFKSDFIAQLMGSFDNLDNITDGLLVQGENFQALNLLLNRYRQQIKYIHIDPPYNTSSSGFLYKNDYQHSSWLSMMVDRIKLSYAFLNNMGCFGCHIDENEYERLRLIFDNLNVPYLGTIIWDKRNPMMGSQGIAIQHEYILWASQQIRQFPSKNDNAKAILHTAAKLISEHGGVNDKSCASFKDWIKNNRKLSGGERLYCHLEKDQRVYRLVAMTWPNPNKPPEQFFVPLIHPITKKPCPVPSRGWSRTPTKMQELLNRDEIVFGKDETTQPQRKIYLSPDSSRPISSVIYNGKKGKSEIEALGLDFSYCHPVSLYEELTNGALVNTDSDIVLDYFAGSGTTAHAVINRNRDDGAGRKFILVEMADYFDSILLPRIKKVIFSPEWKDGRPKRMATQEEANRSPRIIKYVRLESYEDALTNISFKIPQGQQFFEFDDYLLNYMLDFETKDSETFLNVEMMDSPFSYKLVLTEDLERREKPVDLPETFNYLIGLHVKTRKVYSANRTKYVVYRGNIDSKDVAVIWRETKGWGKNELEKDKKFVLDKKLTEGADEIFVNGNSFISYAKAIEPVFKKKMFEGI